MKRRALQQKLLFEDNQPNPLPQLKSESRQEVALLLVQWMVALAKKIGAEGRDEQNRR